MRTHLILDEITPDVAEQFHVWVIENHISLQPKEDTPSRPEVLISSPGGDVGLMLGMFDVISLSQATTIAMGLVQSAAAVLFQAGRHRVMTPNTLLMFHEPEKESTGNFSDENWALLSKMAELVAERTGLHIAEAHDLFDGKFINAQDARRLGLCDEIIGEQNGEDHSVSGSEGEGVGPEIGRGEEPGSVEGA